MRKIKRILDMAIAIILLNMMAFMTVYLVRCFIKLDYNINPFEWGDLGRVWLVSFYVLTFVLTVVGDIGFWREK